MQRENHAEWETPKVTAAAGFFHKFHTTEKQPFLETVENNSEFKGEELWARVDGKAKESQQLA